MTRPVVSPILSELGTKFWEIHFLLAFHEMKIDLETISFMELVYKEYLSLFFIKYIICFVNLSNTFISVTLTIPNLTRFF